MTVTRFAPSPTGLLHLGNIRTAIFNALIARKAGGQVILRIDDTDPERSEDRYVDAIRRDLQWLGIEWDREVKQSDRMSRYRAAADELRETGRLYPCWETPEELALKRKKQLQMKRPPVYDRSALNLSEDEKGHLMAEKRPHWRFKLDHQAIKWTDGIRGDQSIEAASVSDPVLIRADGQFLYSLCSVVDDAAMAVTDIVRGADHVTNTATQIQLFAALGYPVPRFAHHSLMTGEGGEKLSKRLGGLAIGELRDAGLEPRAVIAYLARLGSSQPVEAVMSMQDAADKFELSTFGLSPTRVSVDELTMLSTRILHETPYEAIRDRLTIDAGLWDVIRPNIDRLSDTKDWIEIAQGPVVPVVAAEDAEFVSQAMEMLPPKPWTDDSWKAWTGAVKEATGRKGKGLFLPLRRALTGRDHGPDMSAFMPFLKR